MRFPFSFKNLSKKKKKKLRSTIAGVLMIFLALVIVGYATNWYRFNKQEEEEEHKKSSLISLAEGQNPNFNKKGKEAVKDTQRTRSLLLGKTCDSSRKRPVALTISSDKQARPILGINQADMVFEIPSTGNSARHTRLLAFYSCQSPSKVRSIRSGRKFHADITLAFDSMLGHWGYSPQGKTYINNLAYKGILNNFNALILNSPYFIRYSSGVYRREDTGTASIPSLYNYAKNKGWATTSNFSGYEYYSEAEVAKEKQSSTARKLSIGYNSTTDKVYYNYDPKINKYNRFWGGVAAKDGTTGKQVQASNIIIMKTKIYAQSDPHYANVSTVGSGKAMVYQNGKEILGTWSRKDAYGAKFYFYDSSGKEIILTPGQTWVQVVESHNKITWN